MGANWSCPVPENSEQGPPCPFMALGCPTLDRVGSVGTRNKMSSYFASAAVSLVTFVLVAPSLPS